MKSDKFKIQNLIDNTNFTERELQAYIFGHMDASYTRKNISSLMNIKPNTYDRHRNNALNRIEQAQLTVDCTETRYNNLLLPLRQCRADYKGNNYRFILQRNLNDNEIPVNVESTNFYFKIERKYREIQDDEMIQNIHSKIYKGEDLFDIFKQNDTLFEKFALIYLWPTNIPDNILESLESELNNKSIDEIIKLFDSGIIEPNILYNIIKNMYSISNNSYLGLDQSNELNYDLRNLFIKGGFVDIHGKIGSGKTYTSYLFIQRMINNYNVKTIVIDPLTGDNNSDFFNDMEVYNPDTYKDSMSEYILNIISKLTKNENSNQHLIFLIDESHHIPTDIKSQIISRLNNLQDSNIYKSVLGIFNSQNTQNIQPELTDMQIIHNCESDIDIDLSNDYKNLTEGNINQSYSEAIIWTNNTEELIRIIPTDKEKLLFELLDYNPIEIRNFN